MRILVGCEFSGVVRRALRALGHDAWSCDLLPAQDGGHHRQGDVLEILNDGWDMGIFFPPCTYTCSSGLHWNRRRPERAALTEQALDFVRTLLDAPIPRIAIENPVGCISSRIRKPTQIIHPWQFGHPESKSTCLWLHGLEPLQPTAILEPPARQANGKPRWDNQTASGQNRLAPSADRWMRRSTTYPGIAAAMAQQWAGDIRA